MYLSSMLFTTTTKWWWQQQQQQQQQHVKPEHKVTGKLTFHLLRTSCMLMTELCEQHTALKKKASYMA